MLKTIKEGYNKVNLHGGTEMITVNFERGSSVFKQFKIHSEPGIGEKIYWELMNCVVKKGDNPFHTRIKFAIARCMEEANKWDARDKEFEEKSARDNKTEADKEQELKNFVETL